MRTLPEHGIIMIKRRLGDGSHRLDRSPIRPILPEIPRVHEHLRTKRLVSERELVAGVCESCAVVVTVGEDHDVVSRIFTEHQAVHPSGGASGASRERWSASSG